MLSSLATNGGAPIEYVACLTADEVRAVLMAGRVVSAVLLDASSTHLDRDLVSAIRSSGVSPIGVESNRSPRDWDSLNCDAVLNEEFDRDDLLSAVRRHARPVDDIPSVKRAILDRADRSARGDLIAVMGTGGSGSTTIAMALAQGLGATDSSVALLDGVRRADMAMYHHVGEILPGLPELVDAFRTGTCDPDDIRALTFTIEARGYDLMLGLRRPRDWATLRPPSTVAAIEGLTRSYSKLVAEVDPDTDSEQTTGSADINDRHLLTLHLARNADVFFVVTTPTMKGLNDLANLAMELQQMGVDSARVIAVFNRSKRSPVNRSRLNATWARLAALENLAPAPTAMHVPDGRAVESIHRDASPLPDSLCAPLARAAIHVLETHGERQTASVEPALVATSELGTRLDPSAA